MTFRYIQWYSVYWAYSYVYSTRKVNAECFRFPLWGFDPILGHGLLLWGLAPTYPHSARFLWTSDQPDTETSTRQHTTLTGDKHPLPRWDSNPQSQQSSSLRPRLRPHGHWDRRLQSVAQIMSVCRPISTNVICIRYPKFDHNYIMYYITIY